MASKEETYYEAPPPYSEKQDELSGGVPGAGYPMQPPAFTYQYIAAGAAPGYVHAYPGYQAPINFCDSAHAGSTVVVAPMLGAFCPRCQQNTMVESSHMCALILLIVIAVVWFPFGLCSLLLLPAVKMRRCAHCGHVQQQPLRAVYGCFAFAMMALVALIVGIIAVYVILLKQIQSRHDRNRY